MHSIETWLDRFCAKHHRLGVPNLMLYIVIGNAAVFLLDQFGMNGVQFSQLLTFTPAAIFSGQIWRLVTFIFVPNGGSILWVALSLYLYYFIGGTLEREWGTVKFTVFYGLGVLLNIAAGLLLSLLYGAGYPLPIMDIQYLNLSLFFAFAALYPDLKLLLFFIIPIKVKWLALLDAAIFLWGMLQSAFMLNWVGVIVPLVAILNVAIFFSSEIGRIFGRVKHRTSRKTVNFKKATQDIQKNKGYLHKCAVCGATDTSNPTMEFRYCSKCDGYYCYCMDHINSHVHVQ